MREPFSRKRDISVTLLHVIVEHIIYGRAGAVPADVYDMPQECANSQELLDKAADSIPESGVELKISTLIRTGEPQDVNLQVAEDESSDLIIVGSRGLGAAGQLLLGSVSIYVVTHAHTGALVGQPRAGARKIAR